MVSSSYAESPARPSKAYRTGGTSHTCSPVILVCLAWRLMAPSARVFSSTSRASWILVLLFCSPSTITSHIDKRIDQFTKAQQDAKDAEIARLLKELEETKAEKAQQAEINARQAATIEKLIGKFV